MTMSLDPVTGNGTVTLSACTGTVSTASHTSTVTLRGGTGVTPITVPVSFTVAAASVPPAIGASPPSFSFTATQGGSNPASQRSKVNTTEGQTLTWTASDSPRWLTVSPASG